MKRHLLWWAVGFAVGCGGDLGVEEARSVAGSQDGYSAAGYTACGRFSCLPGYEATLLQLDVCEATQCTALQGQALPGEGKGVAGQDIADDKPPEPIK
jgi:hypothetical protein